MADKKISELTALTGANLADVDAFAVVDTSAVQTKKITYAELKTALDTGTGFVRITGDTMTGTLVAPTINVSGNIDVDGISNLDVVDIDGAVDFASTTAHAGNATFADNAKAIFGAGSDATIHSDGTSGYARGFVLQNNAGDKDVLTFTDGGATTIFHNNSAKLATASGGVDITGDLTVNGNIKNSSGTMNTEVVGTYTIDVGGDIILDSDAANWRFKDAGTSILEVGSISSGTSFYNAVSDASMHFRGNDGGSAIQAMTIDYANGGRVGIGTSPSTRGQLHVHNATDNAIAAIQLTSNETGAGVSNGFAIQVTPNAANGDKDCSLTQFENANMIFHTNNTERARIDSSGNVGIGCSPSRELHVQKASSGATSTSGSVLVVEDDDNTELSILGGSSSVLAINFGHSGDNDEGKITFNTTSGSEELELVSSKNIKVTASGGTTNINSTTNAPLIVKSTSGTGGYTEYQLGASGANIGYIGSGEELASGSAANLTLRAQNQLVFASGGGTERMRIDSSGRFLIGTASALGDGLSLMPRYSDSSTTSQIRWNRADGTGVGEVAVFQNNSSSVGSISHNNSSTSYNTSSDYRLKENVTYSWDATTRLKQLKPARFNWIVDDTNKPIDGFIAHEVSSIVPEAITGTKDAVDDDGNAIYQQIDQSKIVPLLVKTILELETRITALEA